MPVGGGAPCGGVCPLMSALGSPHPLRPSLNPAPTPPLSSRKAPCWAAAPVPCAAPRPPPFGVAPLRAGRLLGAWAAAPLGALSTLRGVGGDFLRTATPEAGRRGSIGCATGGGRCPPPMAHPRSTLRAPKAPAGAPKYKKVQKYLEFTKIHRIFATDLFIFPFTMWAKSFPKYGKNSSY